MKRTKFIAALLAVLMLFTSLPMVAADVAAPATRGQLCDMLLNAADSYNEGVVKTDILKGHGDGLLHEEAFATRAEAMVMLSRAFGTLPTPIGDNARSAYPASVFTDVPAWAKTDLQNILNAGIVAGTSPVTFSPDELITARQMDLLIRRVYSLMGSNVKDDLSATVNKKYLETAILSPGETIGGTLYDLMYKSATDVGNIITEISAPGKTYKHGTKEQKISTLYNNILNLNARNKAGITPIKPYLDAIKNVKNLDELMAVQQKTVDELSVSLFLEFTLSSDIKDSTKYILAFAGMSASMPSDIYMQDGPQRQAYLKYLTHLYALSGASKEEAAAIANIFFQFESKLSQSQLPLQDQGNISKVYNIYTMQELKNLFKTVDLGAVFNQSRLTQTDAILVMDKGLLAQNAALMTGENLGALKAYATFGLLSSFGSTLSQDFTDVNNTFNQEFLGLEGSPTDAQIASSVVQAWMPEYLEQSYVERHFSQKAKDDVTSMIKEFVAIYKERIQKLEWMSDATKAKAIEKLDSMKIKVGYPDKWDTDMDKVEIKSFANGGSFFDNAIAISKASHDYLIRLQGASVDKSQWDMSAPTANAQYNVSFNDITFPAGILQAPLYDVNAPREQNLGGIGYIIAHEITHAFDNDGAQFDANGNAVNWWTDADADAFRLLCNEAVTFYDGLEAIPGIACNGALTLSENIADLGAAACITEAAKKLPNPNLKLLFETMTTTWTSIASRETRLYFSQIDVHAPDKLRGNRVLQSLDDFYTVFDIQPGDGMYLAPEERVSIW